MAADHSSDSARGWFEQRTRGATEDAIREALKNVIDPELGVNIVDLGLVYETRLSEEGQAEVVMTLTSPGCPLGAVIQEQVTRVLHGLYGVNDVVVTLVWNPPWRPEMMSEDAKMELGYW